MSFIERLLVSQCVAGQLIKRQTLLNVLYQFSLLCHIKDQFLWQKGSVSKRTTFKCLPQCNMGPNRASWLVSWRVETCMSKCVGSHQKQQLAIALFYLYMAKVGQKKNSKRSNLGKPCAASWKQENRFSISSDCMLDLQGLVLSPVPSKQICLAAYLAKRYRY